MLYSAGLLLCVIVNTVNNSVEFNIPGFNYNYSMVVFGGLNILQRPVGQDDLSPCRGIKENKNYQDSS